MYCWCVAACVAVLCRCMRRRIPRVAGACPEVFAVFQQERSAHAKLSLLCDALDLT